MEELVSLWHISKNLLLFTVDSIPFTFRWPFYSFVIEIVGSRYFLLHAFFIYLHAFYWLTLSVFYLFLLPVTRFLLIHSVCLFVCHGGILQSIFRPLLLLQSSWNFFIWENNPISVMSFSHGHSWKNLNFPNIPGFKSHQ